jgi:BatD DUF11 like domain
MWRNRLVFLLVFVAVKGWAQNVVFSAAPSANKIGVKDQVQIQYTVRDAQNLQTVSPGPSADFQIVAGPYQSTSSNISIVGNHTVQSQAVTLTYVLQPKHEGTFTIPPGTAKDAAGHTYQSNAVTIQVVAGTMAQQRRQQQRDPFEDDDPFTAIMQAQQRRMQQLQQMMQQQQGGGQPQQRQAPQQQQQGQRQQPQQEEKPVNQDEISKDLFIRVAVDKSKVNIGEQITTTYKLYSRLPMQVNISKLPDLSGFWTQDFEIPRQPKPTEEILDGKKYQVFILKKSALFPQQTGTLVLDPAEAKGVARIVQQVKRRLQDMDPLATLMMSDPFFNNAFFNTTAYKDVPVDLKSKPVDIHVSALPDKDKPAGFDGAVGSFGIASTIDKTEISTDDVATLTVNISGSGNLKLFGAPKLSLPNGLNTFDPQVYDTITGRSTTISGTKKATYAITPHTPGDYDIPAIDFSFFNPQTGSYQTVHTQPIHLHVTAGKHYAPTQQAGNNTNLSLKDIHDIRTTPPAAFVTEHRPMIYGAGYWSFYLVLIAAFAGLSMWKKSSDEFSKDTARVKHKRANKIAIKRLNVAKKLLDQGNKGLFYEEVSKAIWLYLSDKVNIPLASLSKESATEALVRRNVPENILKRMDNVIWDCETALYASGGSQKMAGTYEEAVKVISDLEDVIKA